MHLEDLVRILGRKRVVSISFRALTKHIILDFGIGTRSPISGMGRDERLVPFGGTTHGESGPVDDAPIMVAGAKMFCGNGTVSAVLLRVVGDRVT
jgi:hypothetical protein